MLIGQAPGAQEMKRGRTAQRIAAQPVRSGQARTEAGGIAFTGDAGRRLCGWLNEAGFSNEEIRAWFHKTSVTKCYPGKRPGGGDRKPTRREIELCRHFLEEQIRLLDPMVLIPMGAVALGWFFPERGLDTAVGRRLRWRGRTVVCLPHASGASTWWKSTENQKLLKRAKTILRRLRKQYLENQNGR